MSKVNRLVREYLHKVEPRGMDFDRYFTQAVEEAGAVLLRRFAGEVLAVDPETVKSGPARKARKRMVARDHAVGETATWNVFLERDLPKMLNRT